MQLKNTFLKKNHNEIKINRRAYGAIHDSVLEVISTNKIKSLKFKMQIISLHKKINRINYKRFSFIR